MIKELGNFSATGIGSLPHRDVDEANRLIRDCFSKIPHWVQLPMRSYNEGFINQYLESLIKLELVKTVEGKTPQFDTESDSWLEQLTAFYELHIRAEVEEEALNYFGFSKNSALGFYSYLDKVKSGYFEDIVAVKGQVSGPVTLGLQVTEHNRRSSYYNSQLRDVLVKTLANHAKWQTKKLVETGYPAVVFVDDPGLYSLGLSTHITLTKEQVLEDLKAIFNAVQEAGGIPGSHTCAKTDWPMLLDSGIKVVNFDAYQYFSSLAVYPEEIDAFLKKGGILAFGIVPTSEYLIKETVDSLYKKLFNQLNQLVKKGVNEKRLMEQIMITPSCGAGALNIDLSIQVYETTRLLGEKINKVRG
ncbi:hypothetical protein GGQ84_001164 [Desulfitispora alkaliphila]|uniref:methionine synthase n=1 Tax=Desulfitispora alkaliphila TaxID=622674 RepID=UPI003D1FF1CC